MANIMEILGRIKTAIYGRDVRQSIYDAILQCYNDATGNPESIAAHTGDTNNPHNVTAEQVGLANAAEDISQAKKDISGLKNPEFEDFTAEGSTPPDARTAIAAITSKMSFFTYLSKVKAALMGLVLTSLEEEVFMKNNVRFRVIGDRQRLPKAVQQKLRETEEHTAGNDTMTMVMALSYSSKWEITDAMQQIARKVQTGEMKPEEITENTISEHLATNFMPDPELLIRTGGELRISNYLLWQIAYSELYFCDTYWPDFNEEELHKAVDSYNSRQRRFGKTEAQIEMEQHNTAKK